MAKKVVSNKSAVTSKEEEQKGGDIITVKNVGPGAALAAGRGANASITNTESLTAVVTWMVQINRVIDSSPDISRAEKDDLKQQVEKISDEIQKGSKAEMGRLEKLINAFGVMAPDIFEVIMATLANPLAGIGLVIKKIGDRAKLEKTSSEG